MRIIIIILLKSSRLITYGGTSVIKNILLMKVFFKIENNTQKKIESAHLDYFYIATFVFSHKTTN